ncbi:threonine dehydratase [Hydrocarboniphaga sp.]|uniref:threonine dehydratase n=1 Tax=Hydrocarboniphaga sp. TaxID=2033016 RepID=UPI003D1505CF
MQPRLAELEAAARIVHASIAPTPQYRWPLLCERLGAEVWLKHENHTQVGAFKIRGGLVYFDHLLRDGSRHRGVVAATRGNHGQSVGFAAQRHGIAATIVVPFGNSREKNAAMRSLGVELIEHGEDFQAAREQAEKIAADRHLHLVPSFHPLLVAGVASYWLEFFRGVAGLDTVYVPIGQGSGICAAVAARDALQLPTEIVGVVSSGAPAYALSFAQGSPIEHAVTTQLADGMACRKPDPAALEIIRHGVQRIVEVGEDDIADAMRTLFQCTHQLAEGAGAASYAAAALEATRNRGGRVGLVLSGGNVDRDVFARVVAG